MKSCPFISDTNVEQTVLCFYITRNKKNMNTTTEIIGEEIIASEYSTRIILFLTFSGIICSLFGIYLLRRIKYNISFLENNKDHDQDIEL